MELSHAYSPNLPIAPYSHTFDELPLKDDVYCDYRQDYAPQIVKKIKIRQYIVEVYDHRLLGSGKISILLLVHLW